MTKLWGVGLDRGLCGTGGFRSGAMLVCAALSLAACGGSQPKADAPAESAAEPATEAPPAEPAKAEESWGGEDKAVSGGGDSAPSNAPSDAAAPSPGSGAAPGEAGGPAPAQTGGAAETRTTQVIADVVNKNRPKVRACYEAVQKKLPDLAGDLVLKFTLDAEGKVKSIEQDLEKSTLKNPEVAKCAMDEIKSWKFPPSSRGMDTTVNYPFNFRPKK